MKSVTIAAVRSRMALGMNTPPMVKLAASEYATSSIAKTHVTRRCELGSANAAKRGTPEARVTATSW